MGAKPNLARLMRKWQKILRLQDWTIRIDYATPGDMHEEAAIGQVHWSLLTRTATVKIVPEAMWSELARTSCTTEGVVVHELLHVVLAPTDIPDERKREHEQAVNALEEAFRPMFDA